MTDFELYLRTGLSHIADVTAYDHILFIVALCAIYQFKDWKQTLVLVTAFTIGHSITLALATLGIVVFSGEIIEILIPITIMLTCIFNIFTISKEKSNTSLKYLLALSFGLIHGLGFSNYLTSLLGEEENIIFPLFSFNLGIEIGQLMIVAIIMILGYIVMDIIKLSKSKWNWIVSSTAFIIATGLLIDLLR
jgi:hypothetical protein